MKHPFNLVWFDSCTGYKKPPADPGSPRRPIKPLHPTFKLQVFDKEIVVPFVKSFFFVSWFEQIYISNDIYFKMKVILPLVAVRVG